MLVIHPFVQRCQVNFIWQVTSNEMGNEMGTKMRRLKFCNRLNNLLAFRRYARPREVISLKSFFTIYNKRNVYRTPC